VTPLTDVPPADLAALAPWAAQLAQTFVALAGDVALLVDARGVITQVALGASVLLGSTARDWVGQRWIDTVSGETRPKIEKLLADVAHDGRARARQVNHPSAGADIPVAYSAVRLGGEGGPLLVLGREMADAAQMQRRLIEIQQEMDRSAWRQRSHRSHHAQLIHAASDGVLRLDAAGRVLAANHAAGALFGRPAAALEGAAIAALFDAASQSVLARLLGDSADTTLELPARPLGSPALARLALVPWPQGHGRLLRVRVIDADPAGRHRAYTRLVDRQADAVFVADAQGRLLAANPALVRITGATAEGELVGRPIGDWLHGDDEPALAERLGSDGVVAHGFATVQPFDGEPVEVELSGSLIGDGESPLIGATLRRIGAPGEAERLGLTELQAAIERLAQALGERRLPELMAEASALAERHLIRAALERCHGDTELAAELLGLRRGDLERRMRRTGADAPARRH
jgi:transcriptional regulator PpsR